MMHSFPIFKKATLLSLLSKKTSHSSSILKVLYNSVNPFLMHDMLLYLVFPILINMLILRSGILRLPFALIQLLKNPFLTISSAENMHSVQVSLCMKKRSGFFC